MQTYLHHLLGMVCYYLVLVSPYKSCVNISMGIIVVEVSSPFMHYRQFLYIHKLQDTFL